MKIVDWKSKKLDILSASALTPECEAILDALVGDVSDGLKITN